MRQYAIKAFLTLGVGLACLAGPRLGHANNAACWGHGVDDKERGDISCTKLTPRLFVQMHGATRAQVLKAMDATGRAMNNDTLHFISNAGYGKTGGTGFINFTFENDRVVVIYADVDPPNMEGKSREYIWNAKAGKTCGDFKELHDDCE